MKGREGQNFQLGDIAQALQDGLGPRWPHSVSVAHGAEPTSRGLSGWTGHCGYILTFLETCTPLTEASFICSQFFLLHPVSHFLARLAPDFPNIGRKRRGDGERERLHFVLRYLWTSCTSGVTTTGRRPPWRVPRAAAALKKQLVRGSREAFFPGAQNWGAGLVGGGRKGWQEDMWRLFLYFLWYIRQSWTVGLLLGLTKITVPTHPSPPHNIPK